MNSTVVSSPRARFQSVSRPYTKPATAILQTYFRRFRDAAVSAIVCALLLVTGALELRAAVAGTVDSGFAPYANGAILTVAAQPDGKILIGGSFTEVNGQPRQSLARLHPDGTVEDLATFAVGPGVGGVVERIAIQADGKILVAGSFQSIGGEARVNFARLHPDGTVESAATFNPDVAPNAQVHSIAIQPDGKILLAGSFGLVANEPRRSLARLHPDGSLESTTTFNTTLSFGPIYAMALQADGKIVIGGAFSLVNNEARKNIARLHPDGSAESTATFKIGSGITDASGYGTVLALAIAPDGKILVGGDFTRANGEARERFCRLNPDGSVDATAAHPDSPVVAIALQADGKILLSGYFEEVNEENRNGIARLLPDGTLESTASFHVGNGADLITSLALQPNGRILLGGWFTNVDGRPRNHLARLENDAGAQSLAAVGSSVVRWLRSGALPEVEQVTFESSDNGGATWTPLGSGTRITGGWELTGASLPPTGSLRARARNADSSTGESTVSQRSDYGVTSAPVITTAPAGDLTTSTATLHALVHPGNLATTVSFYVDGVFHSSQLVPPGGSAIDVSLPVTGLSPGSVGVARADAQNSAGIVVGNAVSFSLLPAPTAAPEPGFTPSFAGSFVRATALQPDGKIVVAGLFTGVNGQMRNRIVRLLPDGTLESTATFNPGTGPNARVNCIAIQPDGKILIAGFFTSVDGQPRGHIARLNPDGSLESTSTFNPGTGTNDYISSMVLQPDGKIVIGGLFMFVNNEFRSRIARLNSDGSVESLATFNIGNGVGQNEVYALALQPDGKILLGGSFGSVNGQPRNRLARLNADGTLEAIATFNQQIVNETVFCIAVQPDGKILIGGDFSYAFPQTRFRIARLQSNGVLDPAFDAGEGPNARVQTIALQADGKILIGGEFDFLGNQPRSRVARLNADGSVEPLATFNTGNVVDDEVYSLALQPDGRILVGGGFSFFNLEPRNRLARLPNGGAYQTLLVPSSNLVRWVRGGTAPEVWRVTFELSTDAGANWTPLGNGIRAPGGWELSGLNLPGNGLVRARGYTSGGYTTSSGGIMEQVIASAPDVTGPTLTLPGNLVVEATGPSGAIVTYTATASDPAGVISFNAIPASATPFPLGTTMVNVTATDSLNHTSNGSFLVTVRDTTPPQITVLGSNPAVVLEGATYVDAGATAQDVVSGTLTSSITAQGAVNTTQVGSYTVTYSVTDNAGNPAQATRTVNVVPDPATDSAPPVVFVDAPKPLQSLTATSLTFRGRATDDTRVSRVEVALNGNAPLITAMDPPGPEFAWTLAADPETGLNTATVIAYDQFNKASAPVVVTFTFVHLRPEIAGNYNGRLEAAPGSQTPMVHEGLITITVLPLGTFTGKVLMNGTNFPFAGTLLNDGSARFGSAKTERFDLKNKRIPGAVSLGELAFAIDAEPDVHRIAGTLTHSGTVVATLAYADRALYTAVKNPAPPRMNVPASLANPLTNRGKYTAIFRAAANPSIGLAPADFPQGSGWAKVRVLPSGRVTLIGRLADGSLVIYGNALSKSNELPVYVPLYDRTGFISARVAFDDSQPQTDARAAAVKWFKPANPADKVYPAGWPTGITTDFRGSKLISPRQPTPANPAPVYLAGTHNILGLPSPTAVTFSFALGSFGFSRTATVNAQSVIGGAGPNLPATLSVADGTLKGSFTQPPGRIVPFSGVVLQKTRSAEGFFLLRPSPSGPVQSGSVTVRGSSITGGFPPF